MKITQTNYNQNQTHFKGVYHFSVPLKSNSLTKLSIIDDKLKFYGITAKQRGVDALKGNAYLKLSSSRENDMELIAALKGLVAEIRGRFGALTIYRAANIHGLNEQELRNIKIDVLEREIF